jgi:signal peptidase II
MFKTVFSRVLIYWVAALVLVIDQYSKYLVRTNLAVGEAWSPTPELMPYIRALHIENTGAAFGMFQNLGLVFMVVAIIVSLSILYYSFQVPEGQLGLRVILGLILGGALGNLIDRVAFGPVTDFISVYTFAIFNVADASISCGVALMLLLMLFERKKPAPQPPAPEEPPAPVTE